jgi:hypothetical protein
MTAVVEQFNAEKTLAEGRRQAAVAAAQLAYRVARQAELATWENTLAALRKRHDLLKSDASHPDLAAASRALDELRQPSPRPLLAVMGAAIQAADRQYHAEVRAAAARLGIHSEG